MDDSAANTVTATSVKGDKPKTKPPRKAKRGRPTQPKPAKKRLGRPKGSKNRKSLGNGNGTGEFLALVKKGRGYRQFHATNAKGLSRTITELVARGSSIETVSAYKRIGVSFRQHVELGATR